MTNKIVKLVFFILLFLIFGYSSGSDELPKNCQTNCVSSYGIELGTSPAGIKSYSNCNSSCIVYEPFYYKGTYTGIKWQCVEYARRWLLQQHGVVYGDVDIAADIWQIDHVSNPNTGELYKFDSFVNGSESKPSKGDLLVYGKEYLGTGHVAVIVYADYDNGILHLAEQNYANNRWVKNYARDVSLISNNGKFWVLDSYLIGWKRFTPE